MKKLFFFLAAAIVLFASCSSDETEPVVDNGKTYKVSFNVANFESNSEPLKADYESGWVEGNYCHYVIYKDNGELLKNKVMEMGAFNPNDVQIVEELPAGSYHIAVISAQRHALNRLVLENPTNFYTDYVTGNAWIIKHSDNQNIYFEKMDFVVDPVVGSIENNIVLKPMWSELDIQVTDADVCSLPAGTNMIECVVNPHYYGFNLFDGIATQSYEDILIPSSAQFVSDSAFRLNMGIYNKMVTASQDVTVKLIFARQSPSEGGTILAEKVIYKGNLEGGKHITLSGKIGNIYSDINAAGFNITLKGLEDGGVIPFNE